MDLEKYFNNMIVGIFVCAAIFGAAVAVGVMAICKWVLPHIHIFWK